MRLWLEHALGLDPPRAGRKAPRAGSSPRLPSRAWSLRRPSAWSDLNPRAFARESGVVFPTREIPDSRGFGQPRLPSAVALPSPARHATRQKVPFHGWRVDGALPPRLCPPLTHVAQLVETRARARSRRTVQARTEGAVSPLVRFDFPDSSPPPSRLHLRSGFELKSPREGWFSGQPMYLLVFRFTMQTWGGL